MQIKFRTCMVTYTPLVKAMFVLILILIAFIIALFAALMTTPGSAADNLKDLYDAAKALEAAADQADPDCASVVVQLGDLEQKLENAKVLGYITDKGKLYLIENGLEKIKENVQIVCPH